MLGIERADIRTAASLLLITVRDRYLGSTLGSVWAILNPLLMMLVFVFLFGYMFRLRLPGAESTDAYAIWLISAYGPWIATVEALVASAGAVLGAANLVKNVPFKTELLPITAVLSSLITLSVALLVLAVLVGLNGTFTWHAVLVVPVVAVHYLMLIGLGLMLATLTVFFRDIVQILPNLLTVILFTSPILYPLEAMPKALQALNLVNPFYILCNSYRAALVQGKAPDLPSLLAVAVLSLLLILMGLTLFRRAKGHFEAYL